MKTSLKSRWVEALRSGLYKQGRTRLRDNNEAYCCLGVLCDVIDPKGWTHDAEGYRWSGQNSYLPVELNRELQLFDKEIALTVMNDNGNQSFDEIADYIEKEV